MEFALEVSFYALGVALGIGMLMVLVLLKDVLFRRKSLVLAKAERVPTTALDAVRELMTRLKAAYAVANGKVKEELSYEIKHLENRLEALEDKSYADQLPYLDAVKARERVWLEWRSMNEEARMGGRARAKALASRIEEARLHFTVLDKEVNDEFRRAAARDALTLQDLEKSGILTPEVLYPEGGGQGEQRPAGDGDAGSEAEQQAAGEDASAPAPPEPRSKWSKPLPPYPPAAGGDMYQADILDPMAAKSERTYRDPTLSLSGAPGGVLENADFSLSSLAEVVFTGLHRYRNCAFIGTDLRRIELDRADGGLHVFQDCNFKGSSLGQSTIRETIFRRCNLSNTHWRGARLDRVKFEECTLEGVNWEEADLSRTLMSEDMLARADFSQAGQPPHNYAPPPAAEGETPPPPEGPGTPRPAPDEAAAVAHPPGDAPGDGGAPPQAGGEPPPQDPAPLAIDEEEIARLNALLGGQQEDAPAEPAEPAGGESKASGED